MISQDLRDRFAMIRRPKLTPQIAGQTVAAWFRKAARTLAASAGGFQEDRIALRASALTLYTLLSIVPVLAMAFGIAKGFGFEKLLEKELMDRFVGQEEAVMRVIDFSGRMLAETRGGLMAAIGVIFLLWSVIKMLSNIEEAFNSIWWIKKSRPLSRKFSDYLALTFTAPLLIIFSSSTTVFISTRLTSLLEEFGAPQIVETGFSMMLKLLPFITIWGLFTFLYVFIPNKKVDIRAAFAGGVIAGTVYQTAQVLYIKFQVGVSHYNAIYGSFAALPLFLIWLQASWLILLVGAEVASFWENSEVLEQKDMEYNALSFRQKKLMALRIALVCVRNFARGEEPPSDAKIAAELEIPLRIARKLLTWLTDCRILSQVTSLDGVTFQPARDIETISIMGVINALENQGRGDATGGGTLEFEALDEALETFATAAAASPGERLLRDI